MYFSRFFIPSVVFGFITVTSITSGQCKTPDFPILAGELKQLADGRDSIDYKLANEEVTAETAKDHLTNFLKAIDKKDLSYFQAVKKSDCFGIMALTCLAEEIAKLSPATKTQLKTALKKVIVHIGYGAMVVDTFID